jgi:hypothetical protein
MKLEVARSDKLKALVGAIALAIAVAVLAPPAVEAAVQRVRGTVTSKVKDTAGGTINSKRISPQGVFQSPGSSGALDVRTFGAGNGFLGAADCTVATADGLPNAVTVDGGSIVTGILVTGTNAEVTVTAASLGGGALPLLNLVADADNPNVAFSLGNGLAAKGNIFFTCTSTTGPGDGAGNVVVIGQDN